MARCVGQRHVDRPVSRRAFDGARTIGNTATSRNLPRSGGAARRARCRHRVRSRQASCGLRQLRRAAPASIGSTATVRVTVGTATRQRTRATLPSCPTRAASRRGAARFAHPVRGRRTSWAASFSAGACHWEADRKPRRSPVAPGACRYRALADDAGRDRAAGDSLLSPACGAPSAVEDPLHLDQAGRQGVDVGAGRVDAE